MFTFQTMLKAERDVISQQGNAFQGLRKADIVAREKTKQLIKFQAERILALKKEIAYLRRKSGRILPPIQAPTQN